MKSGDAKVRRAYNANVGRFYGEIEPPLTPLTVDINDANGHLITNGNCITFKDSLQDIYSFYEAVETLYFAIPIILNVDFFDPPYVVQVEGKVGHVPFNWEVASSHSTVEFVTKEKQESKIATAWNRFALVSVPHRRRLIAALHYFHVACRLKQVGNTPGEFLSEAILNFSKVLEVLYGPKYDNVRNSLKELNFSSEEIERDFIPVMILRNSLDVGHPMIAALTQNQLDILHIYAERVEQVFRDLLNKLFYKIEFEKLDIPPYEVKPADKDTHDLIELLRKYLESLKPNPSSAQKQ